MWKLILSPLTRSCSLPKFAHLSHNRFVTGRTVALRYRQYSLLAEVIAQLAQHHLQLTVSGKLTGSVLWKNAVHSLSDNHLGGALFLCKDSFSHWMTYGRGTRLNDHLVRTG